MGLFDKFKNNGGIDAKTAVTYPFYRNYYGDVIRIQEEYGSYRGVWGTGGPEPRLAPKATFEEAQADLDSFAKFNKMTELVGKEKTDYLKQKK